MSLSARNWAWDMGLKVDQSSGLVVDMTPSEKLVLLYLAERENAQKGYAYPSLTNIAEKTRLSLATVKRSIKSLTEARLIHVEHEHFGKQWARNNYYLDQVTDDYREKDEAWMGASERGQH